MLPDKETRRTFGLQPVQFNIRPDKSWADLSGDDEYNMKKYGITDPDDLPKYSKVNAQGQVEQYSKNQRETEIKADTGLDTLKKIYNTDTLSFKDAKDKGLVDDIEATKKENERQTKLIKDIRRVNEDSLSWEERMKAQGLDPVVEYDKKQQDIIKNYVQNQIKNKESYDNEKYRKEYLQLASSQGYAQAKKSFKIKYPNVPQPW